MAKFFHELNHTIGGPLRLFEGLYAMNKLLSFLIGTAVLGGTVAGIWALGDEKKEIPIRIPFILGTVIAYLLIVAILVAFEKARRPWIVVDAPQRQISDNWKWGNVSFYVRIKNGLVPVTTTTILINALNEIGEERCFDRARHARWKSHEDQNSYHGKLVPLQEQSVGIIAICSFEKSGNPCVGIWSLDQVHRISRDVPLNEQGELMLKIVFNCELVSKIDGKERIDSADPQEFRFSVVPDLNSDIPYRIEGWRKAY